MYTKEQLNDLYERYVKTIDISNDMFDAAEREYMQLGRWIDQKTPRYDVFVYAQGSFALGTVIKPIDDKDDYDLDLVCEFAWQYRLSAEDLKCSVVKPLLQSYQKTKKEIENKRRCWHVEYEHVPNFHMDIVPAVNRVTHIDITDHDEDADTYEYIGSNPKGYIQWFNSKKAERRKAIYERYCEENKAYLKCSADIEEIKEYHLKTPLQKAIQILKRHRDMMFKDDTEHRKPISIIITTIAADLYENEDNIVDTLANFLSKAESYVNSSKIGSEYHIDNPTYTGDDIENFAEKWNEHPERASAFFEWIRKAKYDLIDNRIYSLFRPQLAENFSKSLGATTTQTVFNEIAKVERAAIENQSKKIDTTTGAISSSGTVSIPRSHHYGQ